MDDQQKQVLLRMVKSSLILLPEEKEYWKHNVPTMTDSELLELEDIVKTAAGIDWKRELPQYEKVIAQSVMLAETTTLKLQSISKHTL